MKFLLSGGLGAAMILSATAGWAGGPVIVEEEAEVVAEEPARGIGVLPLIAGAVVLCLILCGGDDDETGSVPPDEGNGPPDERNGPPA